MSLKKIFGHLHTISHHRHVVIKLCFKAGIGLQGLRHDLSKYSLTEFIPGCKYYQGTRSPNEAEREKYGYSLAWLHHKGRNKHHYEYWNDYSIKDDAYLPVKMPLKYVKEMFCDRVAASKIYKKDQYTTASPYEYFASKNVQSRTHPDTYKLLETLLLMLKYKCEEETLKYIKKIKTYEEVIK